LLFLPLDVFFRDNAFASYFTVVCFFGMFDRHNPKVSTVTASNTVFIHYSLFYQCFFSHSMGHLESTQS